LLGKLLLDLKNYKVVSSVSSNSSKQLFKKKQKCNAKRNNEHTFSLAEENESL